MTDATQMMGTDEQLRAALQRMVDEAERTLAEYKEDMDDWSYAEYDGRKHTCEDLAPGLVAAINEAKGLL